MKNHTKILLDKEYKEELKKLFEKYNEALDSDGSNRIEELSFILEVIKPLGKLEHTILE